MFEIFVDVLAFTAVFWIGYWWRWFLSKKYPPQAHYEFKWRCPKKGCTFEVSTTDKTMTDYLAKSHTKYEQSKQ